MLAVLHQGADQRVPVELLREILAMQQLHNALTQHSAARVQQGGDPFVCGGAEYGEQEIDERQADGDL